MYELSEAGMQELLDDWAGQIPELEEYVESFTNDIIEYAGNYTNGAFDINIDEALQTLYADGFGYTTDALKCIDELESNLVNAFEDADVDGFEDGVLDY